MNSHIRREKILKELINIKERENIDDYLSGKSTIYRLTCKVDNYYSRQFKDMSSTEKEILMNHLILNTKYLELYPDFIEIMENCLCLSWYVPSGVVLTTINDYAQLLLNFENFLSALPFAKFEVLYDVFGDSPHEVFDRESIFYKTLGLKTTVDIQGNNLGNSEKFILPYIEINDYR